MLFEKKLLSQAEFDQRAPRPKWRGASSRSPGTARCSSTRRCSARARASCWPGRPWPTPSSRRRLPASSANGSSRSAITSRAARRSPRCCGPTRFASQLTVPEQYSAGVAVGRAVSFEVDASPGKKFEGQVRYVSPALEANSRTLVVEAVVPNDGGALQARLVRDRADRAGNAQSWRAGARRSRCAPLPARRACSSSSGGRAEERIVTVGQPARRPRRNHQRAQGRRKGRDHQRRDAGRRRSRRREVGASCSGLLNSVFVVRSLPRF